MVVVFYDLEDVWRMFANDGQRERQSWRCSHCMVFGSAVWGVRDGPAGPRVSYSRVAKERSTDDILSRPSAIIAAWSSSVITDFHLRRRICMLMM